MSTTQRRSGHRSIPMDLPLKLPGMEMDGSTSNIKQKKRTSFSVAAGRYATNLKAEAMAPNTAAAEILANLDKTHKNVFFSGALSVLHALKK